MEPMQNLLKTPSFSWAQTVRIALLAEGLHPVVRDEWALAGPHTGTPIQVVAVPEAEFTKARVILSGLGPPDTAQAPLSRTQKGGLVLFAFGLLLGFVALVQSNDLGSKPFAHVLVSTSIVFVALGVGLAVRGARTDNRGSHHVKGGAA